MAAHIFIKTGRNSGEIHGLAKAAVVVGRGTECDIIVDDDHASRRHLRIDCSGREYRVVDLGSKNGTAVNGLPVREKVLSRGDEIRFGTTTLVFVTEAAPQVRADVLVNTRCFRSTQVIATAGVAETADTGQFDMIGSCPEMQKVFELINKVASTDATVLIAGESGTGKELVARALHRNSPRAPAPFIALNCAAIPRELAESELFGHEKGAFTGAHAQRCGKFELADGGTLFLDEVGELPLESQAKLLRVLDEKAFTRVGGSVPIRSDVRLVAASNRNLRTMVKENRFRLDLLYRLEVVHVRLPALRERRGDIKELVGFHLHHYADKAGKHDLVLTEDAMARLEQYQWPGNVRELKNVIERAVIMASGARIEAVDILLPDSAAKSDVIPAPAARSMRPLADAKREHILAVLAEAGGNKAEAARRLGIARSTLFAKLKEFGVTDTGSFDPVQ